MRASHYPGDPALDISGVKDIMRYESGEIIHDPRNTCYYGTRGLYLTRQPSVHGLMGEIDRNARYQPGLRCKSITDAITVQESLSYVTLGNIEFDTTRPGGVRVGSSLHTYCPVGQDMTRRRFGDLGYGDIDDSGGSREWEYNTPSPVIDGLGLRWLQRAYPSRDVSAFFVHNKWSTAQTMPYFRVGKDMYWEIDGGRRTGRVYIDCYLGSKYYSPDADGYPIIDEVSQNPTQPDNHTDHQGYYYDFVRFTYNEYLSSPPYQLGQTIYLFTGMQPYWEYLINHNGPWDWDISRYTKECVCGDIEFDLLMYKYAWGRAAFPNSNIIFDYIQYIG